MLPMNSKDHISRQKKKISLSLIVPVGMPGRAIRNQFLSDVELGQKKPFKCPFHCIITCNIKDAPYCIAEALLNAKEGRINDGFAFSGANVYRVEEIVHVKDLIDSLVVEYKAAEELDKRKNLL